MSQSSQDTRPLALLRASGVPPSLLECNDKTVPLRDWEFPRCLRELAYRWLAIADVCSVKAGRLRQDASPGVMGRSRDMVAQLVLATLAAFSARDFYAYDRRHPDSKSQLLEFVRSYVGYFRRWEVRERVNSRTESGILRNKILANLLLTHHHLPSPRMVLFSSDSKWYLPGEPATEISIDRIPNILKTGEFFLKPACGRWGQGVKMFHIDAYDVCVDGVRMPLATFLGDTDQEARHVPMLVEERMVNHASLAALSESCLNTIRVMTVMTQRGDIRLFAAALRFAKGSSIVDSWSNGGLAVSVDVSNGRLGSEVFSKALFPELPREERDIRIPHLVEVPYWGDVVQLCMRAHRVFPGMQSVGWDVAVTPNGPVLTEGNHDWDVVLPQRVCRVGVLRALRESQYIGKPRLGGVST